MSTNYNVTIEFGTREDIDDELLEAFASYHPATGRGVTGCVQLIITLPAVDFVQVMQTTAALLARELRAPIVSVEYTTTREFDKRLGASTLPALASVSEAAERLEVSRQAVLQRLDAGTLPGQKVGNTWVVLESAVERAMAAAAHRGARAAVGHDDAPIDVSHRPD